MPTATRPGSAVECLRNRRPPREGTRAQGDRWPVSRLARAGRDVITMGLDTPWASPTRSGCRRRHRGTRSAETLGEHEQGVVVERDLGSGRYRLAVENHTGTVRQVAAPHVHALGGAVAGVETNAQTDGVTELSNAALSFILSAVPTPACCWLRSTLKSAISGMPAAANGG